MSTSSRPMKELVFLLKTLEGKQFGDYGGLLDRVFSCRRYTLRFIHIQGSPGANPASVCHLRFSYAQLGLAASCLQNAPRRMATADYLLRAVFRGVEKHARQNRGAMGSGSFQPLQLPPQVLQRNVVAFGRKFVHIAIRISLPGSRENRILGRQASHMFDQEIPGIVDVLFASVRRASKIRSHCDTVEDMVWLQGRLDALGLVAFVGDGAILPRRSGISQQPMDKGAISFSAPEALAVTVKLPNAGQVRGMGIRRGVSVLIGGAFHGKSTLLDALAKGVYPHIPGDGRERVVTHSAAAFVCCEEGRSVRGLDISSFIHKLPSGADATQFWTDNASGSTSQAAAIVESVLAGAKLLLVDEDSSATNFLVKDQHMRKLIPEETITPFFDRVQELADRYGVSTLIAVGGSSQYLGVAGQVIAMRYYQPVSMMAQLAALDLPKPQRPDRSMVIADNRRVLADNFDPSYHARRLARTVAVRIKPLRLQDKVLEYGDELLDLSKLASLVDPHQLLAIGYALVLARKKFSDALLSPSELALCLFRQIQEKGLDDLCKGDERSVFLALPRSLELAGAIHRLRGLRVDIKAPERPR